MPAAPKSPKRAGAPKGKGAVRAKSGCYTCRIRRKKCDEKSNEDGHCETCVRLRLECLGFGTKRPEWLRDTRNVLAVRDRIKTHLAAQGMIKGHSGAGPRNAEREPPVLRLHDEYPTSTSSASPPTPTLSISSSDDNRRPGLSISSMRDDSHYPLQPSLEPYSSSLTPRMQELSPNSPVQPSRGPIYANDIMLPPYNITPSAPTSIDHNWPSQTSYPPTEFPSPANVSSFSPTYTYGSIDDLDNTLNPDNNSVIIHNSVEFESIHGNIGYSALPSIPNESNALVQHYLKDVVEMQYLLAEKGSTPFLIFETMQKSPTALEAVCLLSSLVKQRAQSPGASVHDPDSEWQISRVRQSLVGKTQLDEGDAMAGLHIVSWVLFSGGKGRWQDFLNVACRFANGILFNPHYRDPQYALMQCSPTERFIIKTSMWFDVLASATRADKPFFLPVFREIFDPATGYVGDFSSSVPSELSMLDIMGCENHIVWALAEISDLAYWKNSQKDRGTLSTPALVKRGERIEEHILPPASFMFFDSDSELQRERLLTSQVFRASARVYLHSVLSGDHPSCKEIVDGVTDTIEWLQRIPTASTRAVVRSVVFCICICSCLTDDPWRRAFFMKCLDLRNAHLGNCAEVKRLIESVWNSRETLSSKPVTWRDVMQKAQILLV